MDRGQFQYTYNPGGKIDTNGKQKFIAKSGLPNIEKLFCVLGIESSCDDTGGELMDDLCGSSSFHLSHLIYTCTMFSYNKAAIIRSDGTILGESLASQHDIHEEWGGKST